MLKNRIITASILAPLAILAILFLSPDGFALMWGLIIVAAAYEWSDLSGLKTIPGRIGFVLGLVILMGLARYYAMEWAPGELPVWFYGAAVLWWAAWGAAFRRVPERLTGRSYSVYIRLMAGLFVLFSGWVLMVWLRLNFSAPQVLYLVFLIWVADIAAYFTGKQWGFTKLTAEISPGKTVEGVYGALIAAALFALIVGFFLDFQTMTRLDFVFLSLMTVAFSICGDLFESLAKRIRGVKDSGALLPGHGGVLDRIDSLLSGVSVFYAGSLLIPIFVQFGSTLEPQLIFQPTEEMPAIESMPHDGEVLEAPPAAEESQDTQNEGGGQ